MLRRFFMLTSLCCFAVCLSACDYGKKDNVDKGNAVEKEKHKKDSEKKEKGNLGKANDI